MRFRHLTALLSLLVCFAAAAAHAADEVELFYENFTDGTFDEQWGYVNDPDGQPLLHGLSRMGLNWYIWNDPNEGKWVATLQHHTYDPKYPGTYCLGTEVYAGAQSQKTQFDINWPGCQEIRLEIRARLEASFGDENAAGVVAGCFFYTDKANPAPPPANLSDEIDLEFATSQIVYPDHQGNHVVTASYDDFAGGWYDGTTHWFSFPSGPGLALNAFNVFKMHWRPGHVEWYWQGPNGTDVLLAETDAAVPDEAMSLYFNTWAADQNWPLVWHSKMKPDDEANNRISQFHVASVRVTALGAFIPGDINMDGAVNLQDFTILKAHFGQSPADRLEGDLNGSDAVNLQDFTILKAHFGEGVARAVPEPVTLSLLGLGGLGVLLRRVRVRPEVGAIRTRSRLTCGRTAGSGSS